MNIIDSSGWLEYFADGPNAPFFSRPIQNTAELIVPSITIYEVFKTVLRQRSESDALQTVALMLQGSVIDLSATNHFHFGGKNQSRGENADGG
jgi:toxin FitB